ncbi:GerAB/ArcD/ProY family transporter [Virgibacillus xinjiangensis]|uniref:GerAB/ArcD/ProY family transporter n=1 Tax=Virgibacillus xinjiangensis TaxID=393090 RepID=A0ABV7CRB1_9BACI
MDVNMNLKENRKLQAFYLFFILTSAQLGVGIVGLPRLVYQESGQDAWISVLLSYVFLVIIMTVMLIILKQYKSADIFGIQVDVFGTWLGKLLGTVYILYFLLLLFSVIITYIEILRVFLFPYIHPLVLGVLLISLIVYTVTGGLRIIVGVCFLFFFMTHWLVLLLIEPAADIQIAHFRPLFQASFTELLSGARSTSYTFTGFEILFLIYPFIQQKDKIHKPSYFAAFWTVSLSLLVTMISIGYFSKEQLQQREWVGLSLFKIQEFPFIERLDYVVVAEWLMVILPNMLLFMWAVTYGMSRLYKVPQKTTLYITAALLLVGSVLINDHFAVQKVINMTDTIGFWLVYIYPLILLPMVFIKKKWKKSKGGKGNAR